MSPPSAGILIAHGLVPCSDSSVVVQPPESTTYTFSAIGILASVSATVNITVTAH